MVWMVVLGLPAWASWIGVGEDGQCTPTHPPRHRIEVVRDSFKKKDDVGSLEDSLRQRATDAMLSKVCAERNGAQCAVIRSHMGLDVAIDLEQRVGCAAALVASDVVDDPGGESGEKQALAGAAAKLATQIGTGTVGRVTTTWASGCGAGSAASRLNALLRAELVGRGITVREGGTAQVELRLVPGERVLVEMWLLTESNPQGVLAAGTTLSASWLGLYGSTDDQCAGHDAIGLSGASQEGSNGLDVSLNLSTADPLCHGDRTKAVIRPSSESVIQVWSVAKSGEAWLVWTSAATDSKTLSSRVTLDLEASYLPAMGEELLVAIAARAEADLPAGQPGCRIDSLRGLSPEIAVRSVPLAIWPPGRAHCATNLPIEPAAVWREFQLAPACH